MGNNLIYYKIVSKMIKMRLFGIVPILLQYRVRCVSNTRVQPVTPLCRTTWSGIKPVTSLCRATLSGVQFVNFAHSDHLLRCPTRCLVLSNHPVRCPIPYTLLDHLGIRVLAALCLCRVRGFTLCSSGSGTSFMCCLDNIESVVLIVM